MSRFSNNAYVSVLVALFVFGHSDAQMNTVAVSPCDGAASTGQLLEVRVSNCASTPCILRKGTKATIEMDYIPSASTTRVTTGAFGRLNGIPLPFIGTNGTPACQKISSKDSRQLTGCNQNANEAYTYSNSFNVLNIYPTTAVTVQWELIDGQTRQKIACFLLPAKIA